MDIWENQNISQTPDCLANVFLKTADRIIFLVGGTIALSASSFLIIGFFRFKKLRRQDINNLYKLWFGKDIGEKALNKIKDYSLSQAEFGKLCFENNAEKVLEKLVSN